jgi:hypothetical protein
MGRGYSQRELRQAIRLYQSFRERPPHKIGDVILTVPGLTVACGHVEYIGYRTTHGKQTTLYQHDFAPGSRPMLASSPDGQQLFLLGGRYDFTDRGIMDVDARGRPIDDAQHGEIIEP